MAEIKSNYKNILEEENKILSEVLDLQTGLKSAVNGKDWTELMHVVSEINLNMDKFNHLDEMREKIAVEARTDEADVSSLLTEVRGKLVRCRTENKALGDYINITRNFVRGIIDTALPQSRAKVYSRNGSMVQEQPHSVVLNQLF
ncbi:MAG: hypothetical protein IIW80_01145 [Treponema sp.]|nr:hypothetical protein [Treponema sp.]